VRLDLAGRREASTTTSKTGSRSTRSPTWRGSETPTKEEEEEEEEEILW